MGTRIGPLETADAGEAFALATAVFVAGSAMHRALGLGLEEYRDHLRADFTAMVGAGLSVAAWDGGRMVGCLAVMDFHRDGEERAEAGRFGAIPALLAALRRGYDRAHGPGEVALADMGAVAPEAAGRGLYRALRLAGQDRARAAGYRWMVGELSSAATQHVVLDGMGHRRVAAVDFAGFAMADGWRPFRAVTEPRAIVLSEGAL